MSQEFKRDKNGNIFTPRSNIIKNNVLKKNIIKVVPDKKIVSQKVASVSGRTKVSPIKNNDEIIGVMTECQCGEIIKIYFNYESGNDPG